MTSGSLRWIVARRELRSARSALTVWKGDRSDLARVSRFGGNFSIGLTIVLRVLGSLSVGVGSSMLPIPSASRSALHSSHDSHPSHVLVVAQRISVLFSRWLTMVRRAILITVRGGVSFGAVGSASDMGLTLLGSATENSILHQDA
jgi:hypothetical protein